MDTWKRKKVIWIAALFVAALFSIFVLSNVTSSPKFHTKTITALDDKKATVLKLTASSTAAATAIAAIPGDATTPVADKIADLSSYFLIILMVIFLEKYLVTLTGYAAFRFLIPVACVILMVGIWKEWHSIKVLAGKLIAFGIIIACVIPLSIGVSNKIESTYDSSVEATLQAAQDTTDEINENADDDGNILSKALSQISGGITGLIKKGETLLNQFIEAIAVMLVTNCLIPIAVFFFSVWIVQLVFGIKIDAPKRLMKKKNKDSAAE